MGPARSTNAVAPTFRPATVTAMATNSTPSACVAVIVPRMRMATASVTTSTPVSVNSMVRRLQRTGRHLRMRLCRHPRRRLRLRRQPADDALNVCGGDCAADADGDGICDDVDPCVGELDAIGVCNGDCTADADSDGICDDEDPVVGTVDACGVCNGPGAVFECGCSASLPVTVTAMATNSTRSASVAAPVPRMPVTVCDDVDPCVGTVDACGICNGPGAIYECGCADIPAETATVTETSSTPWVCGGTCTSDVDGDGVCDNDEVAGCTDAAACNYNPTRPTTTAPANTSMPAASAADRAESTCGCEHSRGGIVTATEPGGRPRSVVEVVLLTQTAGCV